MPTLFALDIDCSSTVLEHRLFSPLLCYRIASTDFSASVKDGQSYCFDTHHALCGDRLFRYPHPS